MKAGSRLATRLRSAMRQQDEATAVDILAEVRAAVTRAEMRLVTHQAPGAGSRTWYAVAVPTGPAGRTHVATGATHVEAAENLLLQLPSPSVASS